VQLTIATQAIALGQSIVAIPRRGGSVNV